VQLPVIILSYNQLTNVHRDTSTEYDNVVHSHLLQTFSMAFNE